MTMRFGRRLVALAQVAVVFVIGAYTLIHYGQIRNISTINEPILQHQKPPYYFNITTKNGEVVTIEEVLTNPRFPSLEERVNFTPSKDRKLILSVDTGHTVENIEGCPDWNCDFTSDIQNFDKADVVMVTTSGFIETATRSPNQYIVFFSQESPVHTHIRVEKQDVFNLSLNYRHDSLGSSPYGYTVKLAPRSQPVGPLVNKTRIMGKSKAIAWYVSHCSTPSARETLVARLKKLITVDIYGDCGDKICKRGDRCEDALDYGYHFYIAFENSICEDYITEKLWNQGYQRDIIPIVLKRSIVEPYVPPKSFIAVDDFDSLEDLALELKRIMNDKALYLSFFDWRRHYKVIFLDGQVHNSAERPWGFCQLCRLAHLQPRHRVVIENFEKFWTNSCEKDGDFVSRYLRRPNSVDSMYLPLRFKGKNVESALKLN